MSVHEITELIRQNNCRRMKMRCVGAEDPPCKRCRNASLECVMEKPGRSSNEGGGDESVHLRLVAKQYDR